jgi:uncharacterized SAM-binding protein YcdF (DUF218 family)
MFEFLSKFLPQFVYPLGFACLLMLGLLIFGNMHKFARLFLAWALMALWLGGNQWVAAGLVYSLERQYAPLEDAATADVIVLLGGATHAPEPPRPTVELNGAVDRIVYAAVLYHEGRAPYILVSGGRFAWEGGQTSTPAEEMRDILMMLGVPESAILLEGASRNTQENATLSLPILQEYDARRVLLVTSATHMPRSVFLFEQLGLEVLPAPTDFSISDADWQGLMRPSWETLALNIMPQAGYLNGTTSALKEYIGMVVAQVRRESN